MSRTFRPGEGSEGPFLKPLTEVIGRLGIIPSDKKLAFIESLRVEWSKNKVIADNPKDAMRQQGVILDRMFPTVKPPEPVAKPEEKLTVPSLEDFGFEPGFDFEPEPVNPYIAENGPLAGALNEWVTSKSIPFVKTISIDNKKYTVLGTAVVHGKTGTSLNINATTGNYRKIRECDETILVHFNGKPVSMQKDVENGSSTGYFVWLCHFTPGKVFRFWMNRNENGTRKDDPKYACRIIITKEAPGYRKVSA